MIKDEQGCPSRRTRPQSDASIALVAIAKDEGAYIADWIHHHLYFGVHYINVWINGTSDDSAEILSRIERIHPNVEWRNADDVMKESFAGAGMFQHVAYSALAGWAEERGASHALFLDIDELWTPIDFQSSINSIVEDNHSADVISFPWFLDVPDHHRKPFSSEFASNQELAPNHHVKSIIRLGPNIKKIITHSAELHQGIRNLVDEPFEMVDIMAQAYGSKISDSQFRRIATSAPRAFVTHRIYRSQLEYVAILGKGTAQAGSRLPLKKNRDGYVIRTKSRFNFDIVSDQLEDYCRSRDAFFTECELGDLVDSSKDNVRKEAQRVIELINSPDIDRDLVATIMNGIDLDRIGN